MGKNEGLATVSTGFNLIEEQRLQIEVIHYETSLFRLMQGYTRIATEGMRMLREASFSKNEMNSVKGVLSELFLQAGELEEALLKTLKKDKEREPTNSTSPRAIGLDKICEDYAQLIHSLKNIHAAVQGHIESALMSAKGELRSNPKGQLSYALTAVTEALQTIDGMVKNHGDYSLNPLDLNGVVQNATHHFGCIRSQKGNYVRLSSDMRATGKMLGNPYLVYDALANAIINARNAMPNGGDITLKTSNLKTSGLVGRLCEIPGGNYVLLGIADTGKGIPDELLERMVENRFTTGNGNGLGMTSIIEATKRQNGYFDVKSVPGCGTELILYFQREQNKA